MKAIETVYKGYRFRSRLEARWAVFFDALGLRWEYEPEGFELPSGRYLPDFFIHWDAPRTGHLAGYDRVGYWVEIKGVTPSNMEFVLLSELSEATKHHAQMIEGPPGEEKRWSCQANHRCHPLRPVFDRSDLPLASASFVECCRTTGVPNEAELNRAVHAARSARFEFGESGAR